MSKLVIAVSLIVLDGHHCIVNNHCPPSKVPLLDSQRIIGIVPYKLWIICQLLVVGRALPAIPIDMGSSQKDVQVGAFTKEDTVSGLERDYTCKYLLQSISSEC